MPEHSIYHAKFSRLRIKNPLKHAQLTSFTNKCMLGESVGFSKARHQKKAAFLFWEHPRLYSEIQQRMLRFFIKTSISKNTGTEESQS